MPVLEMIARIRPEYGVITQTIEATARERAAQQLAERHPVGGCAVRVRAGAPTEARDQSLAAAPQFFSKQPRAGSAPRHGVSLGAGAQSVLAADEPEESVNMHANVIELSSSMESEAYVFGAAVDGIGPPTGKSSSKNQRHTRAGNNRVGVAEL